MNIEYKIENYLKKELLRGSKDKIARTDSLVSSGILDSLTLLQLISFLEDEFGITIDDSEMKPENFQTVAVMRDFVERKLSIQ